MYYLFDQSSVIESSVIDLLVKRITIIQGDVAWYIWDLYIKGEQFPRYWPTLQASLSDTLLVLLGAERGNFFEWMSLHYDYIITYLAGSPPWQIQEGHSVTATPFAEGLIAGGIPGLIVITLVAGVLVGGMYRFIDYSLRNQHNVRAALGSTYFCFYIFGWLNSGGVVQLFHVSIWFGFAVLLGVLNLLRMVRFGASFGSRLP